MRADWFKAGRIIMLSGAAIYLLFLGVSMALGPFTWHPDFLGTHGEPYLVIGMAGWTAYEALMVAKSDGLK